MIAECLSEEPGIGRRPPAEAAKGLHALGY